MDQRISFVTLAVSDLDATRRFYVDGLGWTAELDVPGEVLMIRAGEHLVLSLWDSAHFEDEVGRIGRGEGVAPFTLAHNVPTREEVDHVLETARRAGADPVHAAEEREWGGYTGYFGDPDGFRWEIAWNPGPVGQLVLPSDPMDEWSTLEGLGAIRQRYAGLVDGWSAPTAWAVALDGEPAHVNRPGGSHGLASVMLGYVLEHDGSSATLPVTRDQLAEAIRLLEPAEACTAVQHPNLAAWRRVLAEAGGRTIEAVFVADLADPVTSATDAHLRAAL